MATLIMKLQRPITPPDGNWLIYDEAREYEGFIPSPEIGADVRAAMGDDLKGYYEGEQLPDGRFSIKRRIANQDW
jgi:hypothetical protein